jgi:thiol:disulfide interchange protein DsbC
MFPLKMHPAAYDKARVILGAADPVYLLNKAFAGEQLPVPGPKDAKEPVDETIKLGESLGITATPTLVLPDGTIMPGFKEAGELKKLIGAK